MLRLFSISALILGLLLPCVSKAEDTPYHIELIVFSHILPKGVSQEDWSQNYLRQPNLDNSIILQSALTDDELNTSSLANNNDIAVPTETTDPEITAHPTTVLPDSDWQLQAEVNRLKQHPDYHILLHLAWEQTLPDSKHPTIIHLYGGDSYNAAGHITDDITADATENTTDNPIKINTQDTQPYGSQFAWQVNGTLQLSLNRYINSRYQIMFAMPTSEFEQLNHNPLNNHATQNPLTYIALNQTRRMRSNELNYIDHPLYGVLIKVTPIEPTISS